MLTSWLFWLIFGFWPVPVDPINDNPGLSLADLVKLQYQHYCSGLTRGCADERPYNPRVR
jgi:hypothetical protein